MKKYISAALLTLAVLVCFIPMLRSTAVDGGSMTAIYFNVSWIDSDNNDGIRPTDPVSIELVKKTATGTEHLSIDINNNPDSNSWQHNIFVNKKDNENNTIDYDIVATTVEGYTYTTDKNTESDGIHFYINYTHIKEKFEEKITVIWDDDNDRDGKRPDSVSFTLHNENSNFWYGTQNIACSVNKDSNYEYFLKQDKYYKGAESTYSISAKDFDGYTVTVDKFNITCKHIPEKTSVSGKIIWDDGDNRDGIRPGSVTVTLLENGVATDKTATVTKDADGNYTYSFVDLYKNANGKPIQYTVSAAIDGYTATPNGHNITLSHDPEKITITVSHVWDDDDDRDGLRPKGFDGGIYSGIIVEGTDLYAKEKIYSSNGKNGWTKSFEVYKYAGGKPLKWTAESDPVSDYTTTVSGNITDGFVFTHTHVPEKVKIKIEKVWDDDDDRDGKRPASVMVNIKNGDETVESITLSEDNGWAYSGYHFKYENQGQEITYTITEDAVEYYTTTIDGYDITNSYTPEITYVFGKATWKDDNDRDGIRPDSITVYLLANGEVIDKQNISIIDNWSYLFDDLLAYEDGEKIVYGIAQDAIDGYTTTISGYNIINTHDPETVTISGSKTWANDNDDENDTRPSRITIRLLADGKEVQKKIVTKENDWTWVFENVPIYSDGNKIEYTITEDVVVGYDSEINEFDVTNTYRQKPVTEPDETDESDEPDGSTADPGETNPDGPTTEPEDENPGTEPTDENPTTEPTDKTEEDPTQVISPATDDGDIAVWIALFAASIGLVFTITTKKRAK